ncbi:hypothetical protein FS837_001071 [Tulasnella sp. UAMH 9824]|nr:hypothetical protein FS837_001071 [Tulasnella sp. UAMH 9824]
MSQRTNSRSPSNANPSAVADIGKASPSSNATPKQRPVKGTTDIDFLPCIRRCEPALGRPATPLKTPREWEPELSDLDFDFTASPGAKEWQISETADGCAMYSNIDVSGAGVTVEFQKWDW